ncbi:MAG: hypothetical protein RL885_19865 [Planctomycetota bacterium]
MRTETTPALPPGTTPLRNSPAGRRFALVWAVALSLWIGLAALLAPETTERWLWSVRSVLATPLATGIAIAALLAALVPAASTAAVRGLEAIDRAMDRRVWAWTIGAAWALTCWLLRSRNTELGDADMLFQHVIFDTHLYGFNTYPDEYLTRIVSSITYRFLHETLHLSFEDSYAAISIAWGLAFWSFVRRLASTWFPGRPAARAVLMGIFLGAGTMQLFFGYLEYYSGVAALIVLYALATYRAAGGQVGIVFPALTLGTALAFNSFTSCLVPSLALLAFLTARQLRGSLLRTILAVGLAALPILLTWLWLEARGYDVSDHHFTKSNAVRGRFIFLVRPTDKFYLYSTLDPRHLLDLFNALVLAAAPGIGACVAALSLGGRRLPLGRATIVLMTMAAGLLGFVFVVNPDLGPARDWDLLGFGGLGLSLLGGFALPFALPDDRALRRVGGTLLLSGLAITVPFLIHNATTSGRDWNRLEHTVNEQLLQWGRERDAHTLHEVTHLRRAEHSLGLAFGALLEQAPELHVHLDEPNAAARIALHYADREVPASARELLEAARADYLEALTMQPDNAKTHRRFFGLLRLLGAPAEEQISHLDAVIRLEPNAPDRDRLEAEVKRLRRSQGQ